MDRMKELVALLNEAGRAYYQEAREIMTDREYDAYYDELAALEAETGMVLAQSPTQKVGFTVLSALEKIRHESRMLSLDKTKELEKLQSFLDGQEGVLSWKLDGLTIVLKYAGGTLLQAVTRGNGEIGEDITHNARVFKNIPLKIKFKGSLTLRGEGLISYSEFERINEAIPDEEKYKNPRNLCSGTVRQLNSEIAAARNVMFYAFTLVSAEGKDFSDLKSNQLAFLKEQGFDVVEHQLISSGELPEAVRAWEQRIEKNDFASDGLVLTYNSLSYSQSLGNTAKFPRDSIAFKWADELAETTLREIVWNTSRTGLMNPIAVFDPVELEGSTVNRASVHNVSILEELKLGLGDTIRVYKANMIIPQIAENLTKSGTAAIPEHCFVCGGETEIRQVKEGRALYCTNPNCTAQVVQSLSHFASRNAMNIEGLSEETLKKFVDMGWVKTYVDLYGLSVYKEQILSMEGFGEKSYENLIAALERSKFVQMPDFIYALGINQVGKSNAKLLCRNFSYDLQAILHAEEEALLEIDGFGGVIAHSVFRYFHDAYNLELLQRAMEILTFAPALEEEESGRLSGLSFVITGDVQLFKNRKELADKIERLGGKVTASVSKKTAYLINNDNLSASSKNKKAKELNIPILTEKAFVQEFMAEE